MPITTALPIGWLCLKGLSAEPDKQMLESVSKDGVTAYLAYVNWKIFITYFC